MAQGAGPAPARIWNVPQGLSAGPAPARIPNVPQGLPAGPAPARIWNVPQGLSAGPAPARIPNVPQGLPAGPAPARIPNVPQGLPAETAPARISPRPPSVRADLKAPATMIESQRMPSIAETTVEMIEWVFPEHAGGPGQIHGGRMMEWITKAGTLAASRVAHGTVVLGAMDDIDFLHPVRVGQIAILRARVEAVGTSSLEVGVRVFAEDVLTGERRVTLNSHLVFVKVDESVRPRPVEAKIRPRDETESALVVGAQARRTNRLARCARRASRMSESAEP